MKVRSTSNADHDHLTSRRLAFLLLLLAFPASDSLAQDATVGLISIDDAAFEGYTLFTPLRSDTTYLMDLDGRIVNKWPGETLQMAYLIEDGTLLRAAESGDNYFDLTAGGTHGTIEQVDWDGNVIWSWTLSTDTARLHHDFARMPNGNILVNAYELKTMDDVHAAGGDTTLYTEGVLYSEAVLEIRPVGTDSAEIVWDWHLWDHLVQNFDETKPDYAEPSEHPERFDINRAQRGGIADWVHLNTVSYNPWRDEIALSSPHFNEIYIIDHSTTSEEAADHVGGQRNKGGDLLYRWGNPVQYGLGTEDDQRLFFQHDIHWIEPGFRGEGNLIVFNNRYGESINDLNHSTVDEFTPPLDADGNYVREAGEPFGPDELVYRYEADPPYEMESRIISGAQRLANGNTLICSGNRGNFIEVDENDVEVWRYRSPLLGDGELAEQGKLFGADQNRIFKIQRIAPDYPGLADKDLTPGATLIKAIPPRPLASTATPADESSGLTPTPDFSWEPVTDADTYQLQVATTPDFETLEIDQGGIADSTFSPENSLDYGQIYYWRLRSTNEFGSGRYSEILSFSTATGGARQVDLSSPVEEEPNVVLPAVLAWNQVDGASYELEIAEDSLYESLVISDSGLAKTEYTAELDPLSTYYWHVRASNTGPLNWSETWVFQTSVDAVTLTQPVDGADNVLAYTEFGWDPVEGAESYQLQVAEDTTFAVAILDSTVSEAMVVPSLPLAYSTTYHWRVRGGRDVGPGPWSNAASFTVAVGTALEDVASDIPDRPDLKPNFPNPFRTSTTIGYDLSDPGHAELTVYDLLGHEIARLVDGRMTAGRHTLTLDAARYPSGVYLVRLQTDGYSEVLTMTIAR
jgi:hypothetical protein